MNILPSVAERGMLLRSTSICYVPLSGCAALHLACVSNARVTAVAGQLVYRAIRQCEEICLYYSNDKRENKFLTGDCLRLKPVLSQPAPCISLLALILRFSPIFFSVSFTFLNISFTHLAIVLSQDLKKGTCSHSGVSLPLLFLSSPPLVSVGTNLYFLNPVAVSCKQLCYKLSLPLHYLPERLGLCRRFWNT
jgi:hypothetical protein